MNKSIITSVMSQQAKTLNQTIDQVTSKGMGKFGILPSSLADLGILKPGLIDFASTSVEKATELLKDPAMFVGKDGINSLADILSSEKLQGDLVEKGMDYANNILQETGILTGVESAFDTATMLGSSMVAAPEAIAGWVNGAGDAAMNAAIESVGKASQFATNLAEGPAKEVLDAVTSASGPIKGITDAIGNSDMSSIDSAVDSALSNIKVPSADFLRKSIIGKVTGITDVLEIPKLDIPELDIPKLDLANLEFPDIPILDSAVDSVLDNIKSIKGKIS